MEQRISIERLEQAVNIFGSFDENIRLLEQEFDVTVVNRDGELRVDGDAENTMLACKAIQALLTLSSRGEAIGEQNVRFLFEGRGVTVYRVIVCAFIVLGATLKVDLVWALADLFNGLMVIPNLIALLALHKVVGNSLNDFEKRLAEYETRTRSQS